MEQIRVANVGGAEAAQQLTRWAQAHWGLTPGYAESLPALAGVTNGYREPARLGVDRWLALLAAWQELHAGAILVSAGTALTIDVLQDNGQHGGGYIVPGLRLMRDALIAGTSGVRPEIDSVTSLAPGHSTTEAVLQAVVERAAALRSGHAVGLQQSHQRGSNRCIVFHQQNIACRLGGQAGDGGSGQGLQVGPGPAGKAARGPRARFTSPARARRARC